MGLSQQQQQHQPPTKAVEKPGSLGRAALAQWLKRDDDRHRMTLEAIESADRGELISQDDVDEWIAKLCRGSADRR